MTNYAQTETRSAPLATEFGEDLARRWFGNEAVDSMPRFVRGKKKGLLKGEVKWTKVARGGWVRTGGYCPDHGASGYVAKPGDYLDQRLVIVDYYYGAETLVASDTLKAKAEREAAQAAVREANLREALAGLKDRQLKAAEVRTASRTLSLEVRGIVRTHYLGRITEARALVARWR